MSTYEIEQGSLPAAKRARTEEVAAQMKPALYSYWRSSCSYRVRIALNVKQIDYEYRAVHLLKEGGQQLKETFAAGVNPMREVPCLALDGHNITQSQAIIEYLEETRPTPALMPSDAVGRYRVREVMCAISNDIQPVQNLRVLNRLADLVAPAGDAAAKGPVKSEWSRHFITSGFKGLEALLSRPGYAGAYCVGDSVTMADCFLVPQVYNALRFKVDMAAFPTIKRVYEALMALPEVQAAQPSAQPDAEAE